MIIFDYIYFRVAKFFYKKDGIDAIRALLAVSVMQGMLLSIFMTLLLRNVYAVSATVGYKSLFGQVGTILLTIILALNFFYFKGKYWKFADKWKNTETPREHKFRGVLVILAILLPYLIGGWLATSGYK